MTPSDFLFYLINTAKPKYITLTIIKDKGKLTIFTFEKLKSENFSFSNLLKHLSCVISSQQHDTVCYCMYNQNYFQGSLPQWKPLYITHCSVLRFKLRYC